MGESHKVLWWVSRIVSLGEALKTVRKWNPNFQIRFSFCWYPMHAQFWECFSKSTNSNLQICFVLDRLCPLCVSQNFLWHFAARAFCVAKKNWLIGPWLYLAGIQLLWDWAGAAVFTVPNSTTDQDGRFISLTATLNHPASHLNNLLSTCASW